MYKFNIIPAIDMKDHQVVRLSQGKMDDSIVYADNPVDMAKHWFDKGTTRLHLVDLNGAFEGKPVHFQEVEQISKKCPDLKIEVGGGIRNIKNVDDYMNSGVDFCIIGTAAIKDPDFLRLACEKYPEKIILGIDAKNGMVATHGWDEVSELSAVDLAHQFKDSAIESIIYTDIAKDGMLKGMNFKEIEKMASESKFPIIASGGLTNLSDISELLKYKNVSGVIAGKALYEKRFDLEEALGLLNVN